MKVKAVDVFVQSTAIPNFQINNWKCTDVFNRGTRVGPEGKVSCHLTDIFQCRFAFSAGDTNNKEVANLIQNITDNGVIWSDLHIIWSEI